MTTAGDVARWMLDTLIKTQGELYQSDAVVEIERLFGTQFLSENRAGNTVISPDVLREFEVLSSETVVWERSERFWRCRQPSDPRDVRQV